MASKTVLPGKAEGGIGKGGVVKQHGVTTTGYQRGCRCAKCVKAMKDYNRRAQERRAAAKKAADEAKAEKAAKAKARREAAKAKEAAK